MDIKEFLKANNGLPNKGDVYTKDEFKMLVMVGTMSEKDFNEMYTEIQEEDGAWSLTAFDKHCMYSRISVDKRVRFMIFYICESIIGKMVKALRFMEVWCQSEGDFEVTYDLFYKKIFKDGFKKIK